MDDSLYQNCMITELTFIHNNQNIIPFQTNSLIHILLTKICGRTTNFPFCGKLHQWLNFQILIFSKL